jgi:hypothetical protein
MAAHPPGPGFPRQAPSVISCTFFTRYFLYHRRARDRCGGRRAFRSQFSRERPQNIFQSFRFLFLRFRFIMKDRENHHNGNKESSEEGRQEKGGGEEEGRHEEEGGEEGNKKDVAEDGAG